MRSRLRKLRFRPHGREGFTMIEVLIAMVILAVGLLALEALSIGAARMVARADRQSEFTAMAATELETALSQFRETGNVTTDSRHEGPASITRVVLSQATTNTGQITLNSVSVQVTVSPRTGQNHLNFQPVTVVGRASRQ